MGFIYTHPCGSRSRLVAAQCMSYEQWAYMWGWNGETDGVLLAFGVKKKNPFSHLCLPHNEGLDRIVFIACKLLKLVAHLRPLYCCIIIAFLKGSMKHTWEFQRQWCNNIQEVFHIDWESYRLAPYGMVPTPLNDERHIIILFQHLYIEKLSLGSSSLLIV